MPRRGDIPQGKAQVNIIIDKGVYDEIKRLAFMKYGSFRGCLSWEVEQALRAWIAHHKNFHKNLDMANPKPRPARVFDQVKKYLEERYGYGALITGQQIPRQHLVEAIAAVRGTHPNTIKHWMDQFIRFKLIKWIGGEVFEIL
jgi:hypothetical protein